MPSFAPRKNVPRLAMLVIISVLVIVVVTLLFLIVGKSRTNKPANTETVSVQSEDNVSKIESVVSEEEKPNGDIVFLEGVGYSLLSCVNKNNIMPASDGIPKLVTLTDEVTAREGGNYQLDERAAEPLADMLSAARAAGYIPIVWSSYRTYEYQSRLNGIPFVPQNFLCFSAI